MLDQRTSCDQHLQLLAYSYNKQAHQTTEMTAFDLVMICIPPRATLPKSLDQPDTSASHEGLISVRCKRAAVQRLRYFMAKAGYKQAAAQQKDTKNFDEMVRFRGRSASHDKVYISPPPLRMQRSGSGTVDRLTKCSEVLERSTMKGSRKLLSHTTGSRTVRFATESPVTIDKDQSTVHVSLDQVTMMLRMPDDAEPLAGSQNTMTQSDTDKKGQGKKSVIPGRQK